MNIIDGVKKKLPIFQFAAVCLTLALGAKTAIGYFQAPTGEEQLQAILKKALCFEVAVVPGTLLTSRRECPPPIEFDRVEIEDGRTNGTAIISTWFVRHRKDCPFTSWTPEVIASDGLQYGVEPTLGNNLTPPNPDGDEQLTDRYAIYMPGVPAGPAEFRASIEYSCPDSVRPREFVRYPEGLNFCVLNADGTRPEDC